jgi:Uma2 family endonuclease
MSTAVAPKVYYTPEDLLALPNGEGYELVDGQLVERNMGYESGWVGSRLLVRLGGFSEAHQLGDALSSEVGYQCFPQQPGLVRKPDVSFVRSGRLPGGIHPKGWAKFPPDLAVEIVSPNDSAEEVEKKLNDYRKAGVSLIWVIYPGARVARVHRHEGTPGYLTEDDALSGEDVIPGFRCALREILPPREEAEEVQPPPGGPNGPTS